MGESASIPRNAGVPLMMEESFEGSQGLGRPAELLSASAPPDSACLTNSKHEIQGLPRASLRNIYYRFSGEGLGEGNACKFSRKGSQESRDHPADSPGLLRADTGLRSEEGDERTGPVLSVCQSKP